MYDRLIRTRCLLSTLEEYAIQLRNRHLSWKDLLTNANPDRSPDQIASEAREMALKELIKKTPHLPAA